MKKPNHKYHMFKIPLPSSMCSLMQCGMRFNSSQSLYWVENWEFVSCQNCLKQKDKK